MKKLFAILLAFALVGAAFAQDEEAAPAPVLTGGYYTGLYITGGEASDAIDLYLANWTLNPYALGNYAWLGFYYDANGGGFMLQMAFNDIWNDVAGSGNPIAVQVPFVDYFYGYYTFFDMVTMSVGMLADYTFATPYNYYGNYDLEQWMTGLLIDFYPIDGLHIGIFQPLAGIDTISDDPAPDPSPFAAIDIVAKYSLADLGLKIYAGFLGSTAENGSDVYFAAYYTGIEGLAIDVEAKINDLGAETNVMTFTEYFKYTGVENLVATIAIVEQISNATGAEFMLKVYPNISYMVMDGLTLGVKGWYTMNNGNTETDLMVITPYANITVGDFVIMGFFNFTDRKSVV